MYLQFFLVLALGLGQSAWVGAGTILIPPPPPQDPNVRETEVFAESRFGMPPAPRASREVAEWAGEDKPGVHRGPAGLTLESELGGKTAHEEPNAAQLDTQVAIRQNGVQEVALIAGDLGFFPKTVFVTRDIPVRIFVTGASKHTLCIMMDSFQVRKQVRSQKIEEITFTPGSPGKYRFYCPVNGMEGTMIVKELAS